MRRRPRKRAKDKLRSQEIVHSTSTFKEKIQTSGIKKKVDNDSKETSKQYQLKKGEAVEKFGLEKNGLNLEANKKLKDEREKEREKGV